MVTLKVRKFGNSLGVMLAETVAMMIDYSVDAPDEGVARNGPRRIAPAERRAP